MLINYKPSDWLAGDWEERTTPQGQTYRVWSPAMPRMEDTLLSIVFFVYSSIEDAMTNSDEGATGFFFAELSEIDSAAPHVYAVTNAHVIFRKGREKPVLRINTEKGGFGTVETDRSNWIRHPDGDDIAICPIDLHDADFKVGLFTRKNVIDAKFIEDFNFGAGDDVVMAGRFRSHAGKNKNTPVLRFGNIATMNVEKIPNQFTGVDQESHIVEMRSMSGFSGSPVVVYMEFASMRWRKKELPPSGKRTLDDFRVSGYQQRLLGINWGQLVYEEKAKTSYGEEITIELDSSMAGVVPVSKLMDLIDSPEMIEMRKKTDAQKKKKAKESGWRTTSHEEEKPKADGITKEEFEDALRKIARPLPKDEPKKKGT